MSSYEMQELDTSWSFKAIVASSVLHAIILALNFTFPAPEVKIRTDAIEVKMVTMEEVKKNKAIKQVADFKETEVVKTPPKEKIVSGTQKVVPREKVLGDKTQKLERKVQKGDPASKQMTKYKPGTEFQKTRSTSIGTGANSKGLTADKLSGGSGDTYKGLDFSTKSLTNMGKLGQRFKVKNAADDFGAGAGATGGVGNGTGRGFGDGAITGTPNGTIEKAKILTNVGSLTGATTGIIGSSKGSDGLSRKGAIMLSGSPDETVVMGSMDPNIIRQILMDHITQFRYCYQSELDASASADLSGVLNLNFVIGSSGNVASTNVGGDRSINQKVKGCVAGVLRGIQFPAPKGGGKVEVKQPMSFYPKQL